MPTFPIITAQQSNPGLSPTSQQQVKMNLSMFLRRNKLLDFSYDSSKVIPGTTIEVFSKTINTREVEGTIFKRNDGKDIFKLIIEETDIPTQQKFENEVAGIDAGIKLRGTRQIISRTQIAKLPAGKWGAMIVLELDKSGVYELVVGSPAAPPKATSTP